MKVLATDSRRHKDIPTTAHQARVYILNYVTAIPQRTQVSVRVYVTAMQWPWSLPLAKGVGFILMSEYLPSYYLGFL
jgi:hypothetical protein